jgi:hypothetical protein
MFDILIAWHYYSLRILAFFPMTDGRYNLLFEFWLCLSTFSCYKSLSASSSHLSIEVNFIFICLRAPVLNQLSSFQAAGCVNSSL